MLQHLHHHLSTAETFNLNLNPHHRLLTPPLGDLLPPVSSKLTIACIEFHWLRPGFNFYLSNSTQKNQNQWYKQCSYDFPTGYNTHIYTTFDLATWLGLVKFKELNMSHPCQPVVQLHCEVKN